MPPIGIIARIVFLARVPIFFWVVLLILSLAGPGSTFTGGLFDINPPFCLFWVSLSVFLVGSGIAVAINLIIEHGIVRSQTGPLPLPIYTRYKPKIWIFWAIQSPSILLLIFAYRASEADGAFKLAAISGGAIAAFIVVIVAQLAQFVMANPFTYRPNYLIYPFDRVPVLGPLLKVAHRHYVPVLPWVRGLMARLALFLARDPYWSRGYIYQDPNQPPAVYPGFLFANALAILSFAVWVILGAHKQARVGGPPSNTTVPSLAYVALALMVLCWLFSLLSFFFDRWRAPVLLVLIGWCFLVGRSTETDHYYRVTRDPQNHVTFPRPAEVFATKAHPVIIATAGGGIQAGAWTAQVMEGIDEKSNHQLVRNTALISSVSGGSMGALYVGAYLHKNAPGKLDNLADVAKVTRESSIDAVAWGLANPDLWRTMWPIVKDPVIDRGWALERSWEERADLQEVYLSDWAAHTAPDVPAFMFNSTSIETGSPVVFTNTAFPARDDTWARDTRHVRNMEDLLGTDGKLRVSTAARLSASFPYVSPAARGYPCPASHLVDGGYYDNYGVTTAIGWLMEALGAPKTLVPRPVAIVLIRPSPFGDEATGTVAGWSYQLVAPLKGILNIRSDDQFRADQSILDLIGKLFSENGQTPPPVCTFEFAYPKDTPPGCDRQPMSWVMTGLQQACIEETWKKAAKPKGTLSKDLAGLIEYLKTGTCPQR